MGLINWKIYSQRREHSLTFIEKHKTSPMNAVWVFILTLLFQFTECGNFVQTLSIYSFALCFEISRRDSIEVRSLALTPTRCIFFDQQIMSLPLTKQYNCLFVFLFLLFYRWCSVWTCTANNTFCPDRRNKIKLLRYFSIGHSTQIQFSKKTSIESLTVNIFLSFFSNSISRSIARSNRQRKHHLIVNEHHLYKQPQAWIHKTWTAKTLAPVVSVQLVVHR